LAAGGTVHTFMADEARKYIKNEDLKKLLEEELSPYLSGAMFPDSGYIGDRSYGEYAHWANFQNAYLTLIQKKCEFPFVGRCRSLFAHLLGCYAHSIGDVNWDRYFQRQSADYDFNGNYPLADKETTFGMDLVAIAFHKRGKVMPKMWHPVEELTELFKKVTGRDLSKTIRKNTLTYKLAMVGERFIAPVGALVMKKKAPWATTNLIAGKGGVTDTAEILGALYNKIWDELVDHGYNGKIEFHETGGWPNVKSWIITSADL